MDDSPADSKPSRFVQFRRRAAAKSLSSTFEGLARLGALAPPARPKRQGLRVIRDVAYRSESHPSWTLDIYEPLDLSGPAPVVFYVHGGGFRALSKNTHWLMGIAFARQGWRVVNVNYRLAPTHPFPAAAQDACAALCWTIDNADKYGFDLDQLVLAGESAGANLATMLTIATAWRRPEPWAAAVHDRDIVPRVALPACGVLQVDDPSRYLTPRTPMIVKDAIVSCCSDYLPRDQMGAHAALASPLTVLEQADAPDRPLPAFFAPVGTRDPLRVDTQRLQAAVVRLGGECDARFYDGGVHAFHAFLWRENARACWRDMLSFTRDRLG